MLNAATIKFGGAEVGGHFWEEASMSPVLGWEILMVDFLKLCGAFKSERVNDPKCNECWKSSCSSSCFPYFLQAAIDPVCCRCCHICLSSLLSLGSRFVIGQPIFDLVWMD